MHLFLFCFFCTITTAHLGFLIFFVGFVFFVWISVHMVVVSFGVSPHLIGHLVDFPLGSYLRMFGVWACSGPEPNCILGSSNRPLGSFFPFGYYLSVVWGVLFSFLRSPLGELITLIAGWVRVHTRLWLPTLPGPLFWGGGILFLTCLQFLLFPEIFNDHLILPFVPSVCLLV